MGLLEALQARGEKLASAEKTADWQRISNLPERQYTPEQITELVESYTARLKRPDGTMMLRPIQAIALHEAETYGGLLGFIPTGAGKSLISLLLPMVVPNVRVAALLVPPQLKVKAIESDYPELSKHWKLPSLSDRILQPRAPKLEIIAYSELSSATKAEILAQLQPDIIIADEAHAVVRASARTRRFMRYFKAKPETRFFAMSGTLISRSIKDASTISKIALRKKTPFPLDFFALERWAETLDPRDEEETDEEDLPAYNEVKRLCLPGESLRDGFARRLSSTPGVVTSSHKRDCEAGLEFYERPLQIDKPVAEALKQLRKEWKLGEEELEDATALSRAARQLAAGMYTRWIWPKNEPLELRREWMDRRAEWHKEVRNYLQHHSKPGLDSPLLLANAAASGKWKSQAYVPWKEIEFKCQPESDVVWVSDYMVRDAVKWGQENVGIIWYYHKALGPEIAKLGGFPLFANGHDAPEILNTKGYETIVVSANAFGMGFNLQHFSKQLITTSSSNAARWQQLLARTHRHGQKADVVETHIYLHTPELHDALETALVGAKFLEETGQGEQLLRLATHTWR